MFASEECKYSIYLGKSLELRTIKALLLTICPNLTGQGWTGHWAIQKGHELPCCVSRACTVIKVHRNYA